MKDLTVLVPTTIIDLAAAIKSCECDYILLAGGTDLLVNKSNELEECSEIIDLSKVEDMNFIQLVDGELRIGANTTFTEIAESGLVSKYGRALMQSAGLVGSPQIRNRATIGGNVANCSPAADSIPSLIALGAMVGLMDCEGTRSRISIEEFLVVWKNGLKRDRFFIEYFGIPIEKEIAGSGFSRIGARSEVTISKLSIALAFHRDENGMIRNPRIGMGAVGKTAVRILTVEELIDGRFFDEELIADLGSALSVELAKSLKGRASMNYKKWAILGVVQDLYANLE